MNPNLERAMREKNFNTILKSEYDNFNFVSICIRSDDI